ncbi:MAG: hypothetical protein M5U34_11960 [Chloroflexi bacterium]|nr:hypothetical protein [Chloroflexota bacterium]
MVMVYRRGHCRSDGIWPGRCGDDSRRSFRNHQTRPSWFPPFPNNSIVMARHLALLAQNRRLLLRLGLAAYQRAQTHPTWAESMGAVRDFLGDVVAKSAACRGTLNRNHSPAQAPKLSPLDFTVSGNGEMNEPDRQRKTGRH